MTHIRLLAIYGLPLVWGIILLLFVNITNPLDSGPLSVLVVFILIYLFISSLLYAAVFNVVRVLKLMKVSNKLPSMRIIYYLTSVVALGPVFLLALNTINQLDPKDVALVIILVGLGCFYVVRRATKEVV